MSLMGWSRDRKNILCEGVSAVCLEQEEPQKKSEEC